MKTNDQKFISFFIKIEQISETKSRFKASETVIPKIIRILFRYADNHMELCQNKIEPI